MPLLEAMHHDVPVVAYAAAAVPDTLDGAGVLLDDKRPLVVAAAVARLLGDRALRQRLAAAGHRRVGDFALERTAPVFLAAVAEFTRGRV